MAAFSDTWTELICEERLCVRCEERPRGDGDRNVWCQPCRNAWQRDYRKGVRIQVRLKPPVEVGGCLIWQGAATANGYGKDKGLYAHRAAYERAKGPIPEGLVIDHLCCNRLCVEPSHLEAVTLAENTRRGVLRAKEKRGGRCMKGHKMDRVTPKGRSYCSTCMNENNARRRRRGRTF